MGINTKTKLKPETYTSDIHNVQRYNHNNGRRSIKAGLTPEAQGYVQQAVRRTHENRYSIFDNDGLMPERLETFTDTDLKYTVLANSSHDEEGRYYTESDDGRIRITYNNDGTKTVSYDSDGVDGFDRTATYKEVTSDFYHDFDTNFLGTGLYKNEDDLSGWAKIAETFDADGDGSNEVELTRTPYLGQTHYTHKEKSWWDLFGFFKRDVDDYYNAEMFTTYTIKVNRDDMGNDPLGGVHWEYEEQSSICPFENYDETRITRTEWRDADTDVIKSKEDKIYRNGIEYNQ